MAGHPRRRAMEQAMTMTSAEKVLQQAIAAETAALREELHRKDMQIAQLQKWLQQIGNIVGASLSGVQQGPPELLVQASPIPRPKAALDPPPPDPTPDNTELSPQDSLGAGRWV